ncbi:NUDIX domain-containing protein [Cupriavidus pauculus]|uniref:NUDIX domain-containing protein n=1 Tax=Cupriavidus pauculus TaxID=82633 RepID=UPI001EE2AB6B|nr:NUDIX domain-containing protein [Cupriavidus pauculus]GJG96775.1 NUDIX domain-containing protein [Cupriavidus pauculus]
MTATKHAAGLVVVRRIAGEWHFLVLRAYRNWDFPKGLIEPGEDCFTAALREATEETGLSALQFPWGDAHRETVPYAKGKIARFYVALAPSGEVVLSVSPELGRPEHHEFRWLRFEAAHELLPPRLTPILAWANELIGHP